MKIKNDETRDVAKGVVLLGEDEGLAARAKGKGVGVIVNPEMPLVFDKTLFTEPGTEIPWDLLPAAWHFLQRWDAAVPLWRYSATACDVGSKEEQERTKAIVRDLRVLLHSVELLFVRQNEDGQALINAYREELEDSSEKRLAFLRALYRVKPRLCVLPRTWMAKIFERAKTDSRARRRRRHTASKLVTVEVSPGRFAKCNPGDEEKVVEMLTGDRHG